MVMVTEPSSEWCDGYHAPYPDPSLTIGSRAFTQLLPTRPDNPMYPACNAAWDVFDAVDETGADHLQRQGRGRPRRVEADRRAHPRRDGPAARRSSKAAGTSSRKTSARPTPTR